MRPEQINKLAAIEEQLVDVFVEECKPEAWPAMKDKESRGDRYWHKKNALATLTIVGRIQTVLRDAGDGAGAGGKADEGQPVRNEDDTEKARREEADRLTKLGIGILERHRRKRSR